MNSKKESIADKYKEEIVNEYKNDTPISKINDVLSLSISDSLIRRKLFEWNIHDSFDLDQYKDQILSLKFDEIKTNKEIAKIIGMEYDPSIITLAFSRWNVNNTRSNVLRKRKQKQDLEDSKDSVIEAYYQTGSVKKVAKIFYKSKNAVREKLREWNITEYGQGPGNSYWQDRYYSIPSHKRSDILGTYYDRFRRAVIEDEDYQDIAEDLDVSINTVKSGVHRAKNKIDEYLND